METKVTVVGGGLAGLVAAITAAERGAQVRLLEAHGELGGRARSSAPPYVANDGPHVLYGDGAAWAWLTARGLARPYRRLPLTSLKQSRFRHGGGLHLSPPRGLVRLLTRRRLVAPVDADFRTWAASLYGPEVAEAASAAAAVFTFTADPGRLSAEFVWSRLLRATNPAGGPRYVGGGWGGLVRRLEARAAALGVEVEAGTRVEELPSGPVVVATSLAAARSLLRRPLATPATSGRTTLLDVAVRRRRGDLFLVSDLDRAGWVEQYSMADPALAPRREALFQVQVPTLDGESTAEARRRAGSLLALAAPGWHERLTWRRTALAQDRTGALDLPGSTWRDRPAVFQGDGVYLAGDEVAAPGMLAEVAFVSGAQAGAAAARVARRRPASVGLEVAWAASAAGY